MLRSLAARERRYCCDFPLLLSFPPTLSERISKERNQRKHTQRGRGSFVSEPDWSEEEEAEEKGEEEPWKLKTHRQEEGQVATGKPWVAVLLENVLS